MKRILHILIVILLWGCSAGFYNEANQEYSTPEDSDPVENVTPDTPDVASFTSSEGIVISWDAYAGADSYKLYRDTVAGGTYAVCVYTGSSTSYTDTGTTGGTVYYYKLVYLHDGYKSKKSGYAYGIGGDFVEDSGEPNNSESTASLFVNDAEYTIYRYESGNIVKEDQDYYRLTIPAHTVIIISVNFVKGLSDDDLVLVRNSGKNEYLVDDGDYYSFINNEDSQVSEVFLIKVNSTQFTNQYGVYELNIQSTTSIKE